MPIVLSFPSLSQTIYMTDPSPYFSIVPSATYLSISYILESIVFLLVSPFLSNVNDIFRLYLLKKLLQDSTDSQ